MSVYSAAIPGYILFGNGVRFELKKNLLSGKTLFICGRHSAARIREEFKSDDFEFDILIVLIEHQFQFF